MHTKFQKWQSKWVSENLVDSQHRICQDWLMGRCENVIPHKTCTISNNSKKFLMFLKTVIWLDPMKCNVPLT